MSATDIPSLASDPSRWPILADLIRSEQIPEDRVAEIATDFPDFWKWFSDGLEAS